MKDKYYVYYNVKRSNPLFLTGVEYLLDGCHWHYDIQGYLEHSLYHDQDTICFASDKSETILLTLEQAVSLINMNPCISGKKLYKKKWKHEPVHKLEGWQTSISRKVLARPLEVLEAWTSESEELSVLDYGCGRGQDADRQGWDKYDPSWFPEIPTQRYDVILCTYVLNVVEDEKDRRCVLDTIKAMLNWDKGSVAYVTVRRDMKKSDCKTQYNITDQFMVSRGFRPYHREPGFQIYQIVR